MSEYGRTCERMLELFECRLLSFAPVEIGVLLEKVSEWSEFIG